ncbi:class I SAM-dependent methyltransferase [Arthrobacter sp.]|uniref:class I SAM-dependent methyltransferase n=1 Tax=Arthrobacter sp. TaxID=1667 RepID=UPI003A94D086
MQEFNDYDRFAAEYGEDNELNVYNALYERPATLAMVGNVEGRRVLDAGCGGGSHAQMLRERGATVTGLDRSRAMLDIARKRLGADVDLVQADLNDSLPLPDSAFDVVIAPLVMHYLPRWDVPLAEFHRVLTEAGTVIISTHHPFMDAVAAGRNDYLGTYEFTEEWVRGDRRVPMKFWHRPLHKMSEAFSAAGFVLDQIVEPQPDPTARNISPRDFERLTREARFIFFRLHKEAGRVRRDFK